MYSGLNNKLANVPTITGLSDIVADSVTTDTLIIDGNDISTIIDQVPINTAAIAALQQVTTGQSYATIGDTTTFDNNVTLTAGKTMTADNFTGLASNSSQVLVTLNNDATTFYPTFASTGTGQKSLLFDTTTTPLSYLPSTSTLTCSNFSGLASNASQVLVTTNNDATTYYPTFSSTGTGQKSLLIDTTTTPLSYIPSTSLLQMGSFATVNNSSVSNLRLGSKNSATIYMKYGTELNTLTTGDFNVIVGGNIGNALQGGSNNFALGYNAFNNNINGCNNCLMGHRAALALGASGNFYTQYNTAIGDTTLTNANDVAEITCIGSNTGLSILNNNVKCTCIGSSADCADGLSYATAIGATVSVTTSNTVKIGRAADTTIFDGTVTNTITQPAAGDSSTKVPTTAWVQTAISAGLAPANMVTTNTVQNITANKTMYGASLLIDDGTGKNTTLSHFNQTLNLKNNNTNSTVSVTGVIPATSLNIIVPTDGSNPTTAQILNTTVTGDNIPNQTNTYYVSAHTFNSSQQITTLSMPSGQIQSVGALTIGMFITSGLGTNFSNGTYVTGVVAGTVYTINQPALNTTLFKVGVNFSLITTNLTLSAAVSVGTINFNNFGQFQFLTNNGGGSQIMPLSIDASKMNINVPLHVNNTATFFDTVNFRQNNITLGTGNTINLGSGAGSNLNNLVCGFTNAKSIVFTTGGNTVLGGDCGTNLSTVSANNTLVGYSAGRTLTSTASSNVCIGKDAGKTVSSGLENTIIGNAAGCQASGGSVGSGSYNVIVGGRAGTAMITTSANNTLIGTVAGYSLTTGSSNTICGFSAGTGLLTGNYNTIIGDEAGDNITGSGNICLGVSSTVPNAAGSNQIAIGRTTETMFIQGGFNWRFGGVITNSTNGNLSGVVMGQYYTVTMASAGNTITLPNPAATGNLGKVVIFKRKQNTTVFTLTSTGAAGFLPIGSITLSASPHSVAATVFQVTLVADGLNWAIINQQ
jgi:hypothetical protein